MHLGLFIQAAFCVLTDIFAPNLIFFIGTLLGGAYALDYGNKFIFSTANLLKTLYTLPGGTALFAFSISKPGMKLLQQSGRRMSLNGSSDLPQNRTYCSVYGSSSFYALSGI